MGTKIPFFSKEDKVFFRQIVRDNFNIKKPHLSFLIAVRKFKETQAGQKIEKYRWVDISDILKKEYSDALRELGVTEGKSLLIKKEKKVLEFKKRSGAEKADFRHRRMLGNDY